MAASRASIRTHKGYFTRDRKFLDEILAGDDVDKEMVRSIIKGLQARMGTIAELYEELVLEDSKASLEQEETMNQLMAELGVAARLAGSAIRRSDAGEQYNPQPVTRSQFRVASDLKPPFLTMESSPPEMRVWINKFKAYYGASHMELLDPSEQRAYFLARIEEELLLTMTGRIQAHHSIDDCIRLVEERFLEIYPLFSRRLVWKQCKKKSTQKLTDFYHQLRRIGDEAEINKLTVDEHHMFELILSCKHETELFLKLLEIQDPNLERVLTTATAFEAAREIREQAVPQHQVNLVHLDCKGCGRAGHPPQRCPVRDIVCHECGKSGHLARLCRRRQDRNESLDRGSRGRDPIRRRHSSSRDRDAPQDYYRNHGREHSREYKRGRDRVRDVTPHHRDRGSFSRSPAGVSAMVQVVAASTQGRPTLTLDCSFDNGETMRLSAIADTGATRSVISGRDIPPGVKLIPSSETLIAANGTSITNSGSVCFKAHTKSGQSAQILAIVSPDLQGSMLVGWQDLLALNVVPASFPSVSSVSSIPPNFVDSLAKIKEDYSDVLVNSLGECSGTIKGPEMHIELDESVDIKPCKVTTARPVPIHMKPKSDKLMKELVSASVIVPCIEPTKWTSPAHFVDKRFNETSAARVKMVCQARCGSWLLSGSIGL